MADLRNWTNQLLDLAKLQLVGKMTRLHIMRLNIQENKIISIETIEGMNQFLTDLCPLFLFKSYFTRG